MIFRQFLHTSPVGASYIFGSGGHGQCVVIDPVEDIAPYQQVSRESGMRIAHIIDTHVHADHISGGRSLADAVGASYVVHESVDAPMQLMIADIPARLESADQVRAANLNAIRCAPVVRR